MVRRHWPAAVLAGVLCAAGIAYFVYEFSLAERLHEYRHYRAAKCLPLVHWVLPSPDAIPTRWIYAGTEETVGWAYLAKHSAGPGFVTAGLIAFGLFRRRQETVVRLLLIATAALVILSASVGSVSLWQFVHAWVPGADALRAQARVGGILVLLFAVGGAFFVQELIGARKRLALGVLLVLAMGEQVMLPRASIEKDVLREHIDSVAARVDRDKEAFLLISTDVNYHQAARDAAWVTLATGVPTVNGRYGNWPPAWNLRGPHHDVAVADEADRHRLRASLEAWCRGKGVDPADVQWIEYEPPATIPRWGNLLPLMP